MKEFFLSLNGLDIALIIALLLGLIAGTRNGLGVMISRVLALIGSMLAVLYYYEILGKWLADNTFLPVKTTQIVVFVSLFFFTWMILNMILTIISRFMEVKFSKGIDRFGGLVLGGVWVYIFCGFILYGLIIFRAPFFNSQWLDGSYIAPSAVNISFLTRDAMLEKRLPGF
jgi:uncharacterized membrane protein required for colicin V production